MRNKESQGERKHEEEKKMNRDLTEGSELKVLIQYAIPYLLASFLQTFYGMADLYIVGQYNGAASISAVSIGSQFMHMVTVIMIGLAMGTTVRIGLAVGGKELHKVPRIIGNTCLIFILFAAVSTVLLCANTSQVVELMSTPREAVKETQGYLWICFMGIPFIIAYNVMSSIFRGMGDSKSPMVFILAACIMNVALDYYFVGAASLGAEGAAYATVIAQAFSSVIAVICLAKRKYGFTFHLSDFHPNTAIAKGILSSGLPIALQDGFIQISFLIITVIANSRGLMMATGVGVVEKIISFLFLVPSAFLSALSALVAQNIGANKAKRAQTMLRYALIITVSFGALCFGLCQIIPNQLVSLFTDEREVIWYGGEYLRTYALDCVFAAIHFCFGGYFCGSKHSAVPFIHSVISVVCIRIPGAYLATVLFPSTLLPMGLAAPVGSLLSALICIYFYRQIKSERSVAAA